MKKLLATLSLALVVTLGAVGFVGCKNKGIVGTWKFSEIVVSTEGLSDEEKQYIEMGKAAMEVACKDMTITFKKDGTGSMKMGTETANFTWVEKDGIVTITNTDEGEGKGETDTFKHEGSKLISTDEGMSIIFKK